MKRWPILVSFVLFVGLCASITFWAMQFMKPATRPVSLPKTEAKAEIDPEAALALFGGRATPVAAASNYQLRGVVVAKNPEESVAILVADSKPAEAIRVNAEIQPGVTVKEVHPQFVLLSESGVVKRVELPVNVAQSIKADAPIAIPAGVTPVMPNVVPVGAPNLAPPPTPAPPPPQAGTPEGPQSLPPPNPATPRHGRTGGRPDPNPSPSN